MRLLQARGVDPRPLVAEAGIDRTLLGVGAGALQVGTALLPLRDAVRLFGIARRVLDDPHLGLHCSEHADTTAVGTVGFIVTCHPTLREGLVDTVRITEALVPELAATIEEVPGGTRIRCHLHVDVDGRDESLSEIICTTIAVARGVSLPWSPLALELPGPAVDPAPYVEAFGVVPTFGHAWGGFVLPQAAGDFAFADADATLLVHMHEAVEQQVRARRQAAGRGSDIVRLVGATVDLGLGEVRRDSRHDVLTEREHQILAYFAAHPNEVVSHAMLERDVWSLDRDEMSFAPAVAIRRVRQKIEQDPSRPTNLVTVFGEGWKLVVPA